MTDGEHREIKASIKLCNVTRITRHIETGYPHLQAKVEYIAGHIEIINSHLKAKVEHIAGYIET